MQHNSSKYVWDIITKWGRKGYEAVSRFANSEQGKLAGRIFAYLIQAGIVIYLLYELTRIGWGNFYQALPTTPYFYLLFLVLYGALPVSEILAYSQSWDIGFRESIPTFIKKRVYNKTLIGYSGEVAVFAWARRKGISSEKEIFKVVRDNNIMSSLASTTVVFGLLVLFVVSGKIALMDYLTSQYDTVTIAATAVIVLLLVVTAFKTRRYFFSMPSKIARTIFSIHAFRMVLVNLVQVLQWYVVLPEVSFEVWFTFLSVQLLISRIPFLPSRDLLYIGASLEVANFVDISAAGIAGLLVAQNVLDKLLNLGFFGLITYHERKNQTAAQQTVEG